MRLIPLIAVLLACQDADQKQSPRAKVEGCIPISVRPADQPVRFRLTEARLSVGEAGDEFVIGRLGDAIIAQDGQVVVADRFGPNIRSLSDEGTVILQYGRDGEGPGEYVDVNDLFAVGENELAVYDSRLRRVSIFALDGRFLRSRRLLTSSNRLLPRPVGFWGTDTVVVQTERPAGSPAMTGPRLFRDSIEIYAVALESAETETDESVHRGLKVGIVLGTERFRPPGPPRGYVVPMAKRDAIAVGSDRVFAGDASSWSFTLWHRAQDRTCQNVEIPLPLEPVHEDYYEREKGRYVEANIPSGVDPENLPPEIQRFYDRIFSGISMPTHQPTYRSFIVDDQDRLWVEVWHEDRGGPRAWIVITRDLEWLGTLDVPEGFIPLDIRGDRVLGTRTGVYEEVILELYRIAS